MKTVIIYHRADFDGLFSREIARRFFRTHAEYIGWDYGDPVPTIENPDDAQVIMIDISVKDLMHLPNLVWIDHHKSAIDRYDPQIPGYRIDGVAACRLAYQFFFGDGGTLPDKAAYVERAVKEPLAVRLAGEYDVWDKRDPRTDVLQCGLVTCDPQWDRLLSDDVGYVDELLQAGKIVQFVRTRENESVIKHQGFTVQFEGRTFLACNAARYNSLLFTAGLRPEHDGCLGFKWDGAQWSISMYGVPGKPDIDFSTIATKYGGGGHRQACGFRCAVLPFELKKQEAA